MTTKTKKISQGLLVGMLTLLFSTLVDYTFFGGDVFLNEILGFADTHSTALSVILTGLLLMAYLMQYLVQDTQAELAKRQEKLMQAGYTPIVGVKSRTWGKERWDDETDLDPFKANKYFLELVNTGNSTARDLRLWIGVDYETDCESSYYASNSVPLKRTEEGEWWPTDVGGALSETDGSTEFLAEPKLKEMEPTCFLKDDKQVSETAIDDALEEISERGVEEISIALSVQFTTATADTREINIGVYREQLSKLEEVDWTLYDAQKSSSEEFDEIKQTAI